MKSANNALNNELNSKKKKDNMDFEIPVNKEFIASLSTNQLIKLTELKSLIKERQKIDSFYNPTDDLMNSDFLQNLNTFQYNEFILIIKPELDNFLTALNLKLIEANNNSNYEGQSYNDDQY